MGLVFGCVVPHPPLLVPEVGRGQERAISRTIEAMNLLAGELRQANPESLLIVSPHGEAHGDAMGIATSPTCTGSMRRWDARSPETTFANDLGLVKAIREEAGRIRIPLRSIGEKGYELDHGVMVPLYFLGPALKGVSLVPLTFCWLPLQFHYAFGQVLRTACERVGKRVALIASGDLSHRLTPDAPAGYDPEGTVFDEKLIAALARLDSEGVLNLDPALVERAGECGLRSIVILLGALEGLEAEARVHGYEGPFGVGYLVASFPVKGPRQPHPVVQMARQTVETFVREHKAPSLPQELPPEMRGRAGVFVSIKRFGELRGCIGTFEPVRGNIAEEIIYNAISSATQDPRFYPVTPEELSYLSYSVDILTKPVKVEDKARLDPKRYGVIAECGDRRGLLLPDLEGVDTVEDQIGICCRKGGISPDEPVTLYCFEVKRYK